MDTLSDIVSQNDYAKKCIASWHTFTKKVTNTVSQMILWDIQTGASYQTVLNVLSKTLIPLPIISGTAYLGANITGADAVLSDLLTTVGNVATAETAVVAIVGLATVAGAKKFNKQTTEDRIDSAIRLRKPSYTIEDIRRYAVSNQVFRNLQKESSEITNRITRISAMIKSVTEPTKPKWFNPVQNLFLKTKNQYSASEQPNGVIDEYLVFSEMRLRPEKSYINFSNTLDTIKESIKNSLHTINKFGAKDIILDTDTLDSLYRMRYTAQQAIPVFKIFCGIGTANDDYEDVLKNIIGTVGHIQKYQDVLSAATQSGRATPSEAPKTNAKLG